MKSSFTFIRRTNPTPPVTLVLESGDESAIESIHKEAQLLSDLLISQSLKEGIVNADKCYYIYLNDGNVVFMASYPSDYPKKLAYSFLEEIKKEFELQYGSEIMKAKRHFCFQNFENFIHKTRKFYTDTRYQKNLNTVAENLKDVNKILQQSVSDILDRGATLQEVRQRSSQLSDEAAGYQRIAVQFSKKHFWRTYGPILGGATFIIILIFMRFWFF